MKIFQYLKARKECKKYIKESEYYRLKMLAAIGQQYVANRIGEVKGNLDKRDPVYLDMLQVDYFDSVERLTAATHELTRLSDELIGKSEE